MGAPVWFLCEVILFKESFRGWVASFGLLVTRFMGGMIMGYHSWPASRGLTIRVSKITKYHSHNHGQPT